MILACQIILKPKVVPSIRTTSEQSQHSELAMSLI